MELFVRSDTDAAHPQDAVPIYLIHSITNPFCSRADCWCQTHKRRIDQWLAVMQRRELRIAAAASFADGTTQSEQ